MTSVDLVKTLCKERKITIHRLEQDLGFSNGYISQLKKGVFPSDRLDKIARYFGVPMSKLLGDGEPLVLSVDRIMLKDPVPLSPSKQAFIDEVMDLPDEKIKAITELVKAFKSGL